MASRFDAIMETVNRAAERTVTRAQESAAGGGVSSDLAREAARLGIDFGAPVTDVDDPPVYLGFQRRTGEDHPGTVGFGSKYEPRSKVLTDFYAWDTDRLRKFQEKAFSAGFYGNAERDEVRFGDHDEDTFRIWTAVVDRAVGFNAAGQKVDPWSALERAVETAPPRQSTSRPLTVELTNPEDIKAVMREAARDAIGKGTIDEGRLEEIISRWHAQQRQTQTAAYGAAGTGGTVIAPESLSTFAEREAMNIDPAAASAHKVLEKFEVLSRMMSGAR